MANFYDTMKITRGYLRQESMPKVKQVAYMRNVQLPPTPGFEKLGPAAREAARSRAKNFYPFD